MIQPEDTNRDGIALSSDTMTLPEYIKGTPPTIETLRAGFDAARDDENDTKSATDRDYYDGPKQLNSEVRATLKARNQPAIYTNRVRPAVNGVLGILEAGRRDPRGFPRNPDDEAAADVCTKTLRFINDEAKFNDTQMDVAENFLIEGTGAVIVEVIDGKIVPTQIRWEEFYADKFSRRPDFKDARYMGIAKWMDAGQISEQWKARIDEIGDPLRPIGISGFGGDRFEDRGDGQGWVDSRRRRVLLVEEYRIIGGEWKRIVYIAAGVLEFGPSPYLDGKRRPTNPIEAVSCYVDRENGRYGMVRDMIPIQDEVNASRSRSLHLMNSKQVQVTDPGANPADAEIAREQASRSDGVLPMGYNYFSNTEQTNANLLRMQEAKGEIERMGPTPAVLGRQEGAGQSGRARLVSQQAGLTELARPLGRLHAWVLRCYEQMWNRAQQFWTDPMWVRVTDDMQAASFLQINEPAVDEMGQPVIEGYQQVDDGMGGVALQPVQAANNRIAALEMDIILDQSEDTASLQQEVWAEMMQMLSTSGGLQAVYTPQFETLIELSPMSDKANIVERLKAKREEIEQSQVAQLQAQLQQLQAQLEAKEAASEADTALTTAKAEGQDLDNKITLANALAGQDGSGAAG